MILFYVGIPFVLAVFLPPSALYPVLLVAAGVGIVLLHFTKGFAWRMLLRGGINWYGFLILLMITLAVSLMLCWWLLPDRILFLPLNAPKFLPFLAVGYTLILALPQELVFRALFFERYEFLFSSQKSAIFVNAVLFSFAHLMYWHWVVMVLTFVGSFIFTWSYLRGSFLEAWAYHAIAGFMIFVSGLGWLFYSGGYVAN